MTTTPDNALPARVTLQPLRAFHIDHGQGRTVAVLFRVAVDGHRSEAGSAHQCSGDGQAGPCVGGGT